MQTTSTNEKANGVEPLAIFNSQSTSGYIFGQSDEPIKAFCTATRPPRQHGRENKQWSLVVEKCPHCGERHTHGGGFDDEPILGHRVSHCVDGTGGYWLVPKGGKNE